MQRLVLSIILGQFMTIVFGKIVELTCPATSALPIPIKNSLYSSCFDLDITVNVENILPDSTYILPQDNINAISDGIKRTFDYCDIEIEPDETEIDNIWTIDNQCTHLSSQLQTLNRRQFITSQYNTSCDQDTLIIDEITGTIKCQLTFPESIVYVWHLQQINLKIDIESCSDVIMHAKISIYNNTETKYGHYMAVSQPAKISEDDPSDKKYEFKFNTSTNMLLPNITYFVTFDIINASGWHNQKVFDDKFEFKLQYHMDHIQQISTNRFRSHHYQNHQINQFFLLAMFLHMVYNIQQGVMNLHLIVILFLSLSHIFVS
eukprot:513983_1